MVKVSVRAGAREHPSAQRDTTFGNTNASQYAWQGRDTDTHLASTGASALDARGPVIMKTNEASGG
jgi:hypothetical protein